MPQMISLRAFLLNSTSGHATRFEASDPRIPNGAGLKPSFVHPHAVQDAMAAGCTPFDPSDAAQIDDDTKLRAGFADKLRHSLLMLLMDRLAKENQPKNFDAGGIPKGDVLSKIVLFDVDPKERVELWRKL